MICSNSMLTTTSYDASSATGASSEPIADRVDRDLPERLVLGPGRLALLVELEQREQRHRDRHPVGGSDRLVEVEAPATQQRPEVHEPLGDRDLRGGDVADVDRLRDPQQRADRRREPIGLVHGDGVLEGRGPERRGQRRRAEPVAVLGGETVGEMGRGRAVAMGVEQPGEQFLGGLPRVQIDQLLLLAREHQPRFQLEQRRDQDEKLGRCLELEFAPLLQVIDVGDDDVGQVDLEQVDLLTED